MNEMIEAAGVAEELSADEAQLVRIRKLELRLEATEKALADLLLTVRKITPEITSGLMRAFSGVFHSLSDRLLDLSEIGAPSNEHFAITRVEDNVEPAIIVKRTGDHYDFSATATPDTIQNDGTESLVAQFRASEQLADGETARFVITHAPVIPNEPTTES